MELCLPNKLTCGPEVKEDTPASLNIQRFAAGFRLDPSLEDEMEGAGQRQLPGKLRNG